MKHFEGYDKVAKNYDKFYASKGVFLEEDKKLSQVLQAGMKGHVLDIGSGTGWLMDHVDINPKYYMGVDPSIEMVKVSKKKHPHHEVYHGDILGVPLDIPDDDKFQTILAIFGVLTYLGLDEIEHLGKLALQGNSRVFLMENIDGYGSQVIENAGIKPVKGQHLETIKKGMILSGYIPDLEVIEWSKYIIFTNFPNYEDLLEK